MIKSYIYILSLFILLILASSVKAAVFSLSYYVQFEFDENTDVIQSRANITLGQEHRAEGGSFLFIFTAIESEENKKVKIDIYEQNNLGKPINIQTPIYTTLLNIQDNAITEFEESNSDMKFEISLVLSPARK